MNHETPMPAALTESPLFASSDARNERPRMYRVRACWGSILVHAGLVLGLWWLASHPGAVLQHVTPTTDRLMQAKMLSQSDWASLSKRKTDPQTPAVPRPPVQPAKPDPMPASTLAAAKPPHPVRAIARKKARLVTHQTVSSAVSSIEATSSSQNVSLETKVSAASTTARQVRGAASSASATERPSSSSLAEVAHQGSASTSSTSSSTVPVISYAGYQGEPIRAEYPVLARRKGWQGRVLIEVTLNADGDVEQQTLMEGSGYPQLDRAAMQAVTRNQFKPYRVNGQGQKVRLRLPIEFRLTTP